MIDQIKIIFSLLLTMILFVGCQPSPQRIYDKGVGLLYAGKFSDAKIVFSDGLKKHPKSGKLAYGVGWVELLQGDTNRALGLFGQAIQNEGAFFGGYKGMATMHLMMGNSEKAIDYYLEALKRDEKHAATHSNIGDAYRQVGRFEEAKAAYDKAAALLGAHGDISVGYMSLAIAQKNFDEAIKIGEASVDKSFQQVFLRARMFEVLSQAYLERGKMFFAHGEASKGLADLESAKRIITQGEAQFGAARFTDAQQEIMTVEKELKTPEKVKSKVKKPSLAQTQKKGS